ncbi:hypothetical protein, partial [Escherichia coli]|uniref:hypothetical protein n=1 Tax=Escherichia coli TaxID=562 RepID=UPI000A5768AC
YALNPHEYWISTGLEGVYSELAILLFLQRIVFIGFLFSALQVIHRLVVKFLDLVFNTCF